MKSRTELLNWIIAACGFEGMERFIQEFRS